MAEFDLTIDNAARYLLANDVIEPDVSIDAEPLGGGVSNTVLRVTANEDCLVVKQPLANLAVEDDWPADTERVHNEAAAARAYERVIREAEFSDVRVPNVVLEDATDHVIALTCAPTTTTMWKGELLDGRVDGTVARTLGRFLGATHRATADDRTTRQAFAHDAPFEQLRLDPYHRTVAERHPDVRSIVRRETERVEACNRTLVHGDFSPKNVLIDAGSEKAPLWLLDFEVAHWGDPSFDVAFMLNHLFIKAVFNRELQAEYLRAADAFWSAYRTRIEWSIEPNVIGELGVLLLARVDGRSPVEYVTDSETKDTLRTIAKRSLCENVESVDEFSRLVAEVSAA
jgi:5-methylthioribose kinase